tara:strand:- start:282 stop:530 length:249 start_codon:yes stop_codon:yes gene_type:complete
MQFKDINFEKAFEYLNKRERYILEKRFGLNNSKQESLFQIGNKLNISRERVRQIELKALQKLRKPDCVKDILKISDQEIEES